MWSGQKQGLKLRKGSQTYPNKPSVVRQAHYQDLKTYYKQDLKKLFEYALW
jgi:hypothetical protein